MSKAIVHVGVAVSTDGPLPGRDNIIGISACVGDNFLFNQNVLPPNGKYNNSPFWNKHLEEFKELKRNTKSLHDSMVLFDTWLKNWQGRLVACCSIIDFWHLFTAMMEHTGGCPFGTLPIDAASYYCAIAGTKAPGKVTDQVKPLEVAKERWKMVTQGVMPVFGKNSKPKAKMPKAEDPYHTFIRRANRVVDAPPVVPEPWYIRVPNQPAQVFRYEPVVNLDQLNPVDLFNAANGDLPRDRGRG